METNRFILENPKKIDLNLKTKDKEEKLGWEGVVTSLFLLVKFRWGLVASFLFVYFFSTLKWSIN